MKHASLGATMHNDNNNKSMQDNLMQQYESIEHYLMLALILMKFLLINGFATAFICWLLFPLFNV